ncbi:MAG: FHA domain-containing protein, partial [Minicystis sp.]
SLREGRFDAVIDGTQRGGMDVLEHPPAVEMGQVGGEKKPPPPPPAPAATLAAPVSSAPVRATLQVLRSLTEGPEEYTIRGDGAIVGSEGDLTLTGERFCHPREAMLIWDGERLWLDDLEGGNGVFVRIRGRVAISMGTDFVLGDQLVRLDPNPEPNDGPDDGPTYFFSSMKGPSSFRVVQIFEGGALGATAMARETLLQIGSALEYANDLVLVGDPLVARYHATVEEQAEVYVLTDLGAKSGVFVRVTGRHLLTHGDEILVGRTRLLVDLKSHAS